MSAFKLRDAHWEIILDYFEKHPGLATGKWTGPNGREMNRKLWRELGEMLNALGLGERSTDKWQKTWTDFKYLLKKKASTNMTDLAGTGGGPAIETPLNAFERRALNILGTSFFEGVRSAEIANTAKTPDDIVPSCSHTTEQQDASPNVEGSSKSLAEHDYSYRPATKRKKLSVEDTYQETVSILRSIENTIDTRLSEINASIIVLKNALLKKNCND